MPSLRSYIGLDKLPVDAAVLGLEIPVVMAAEADDVAEVAE